MWERPRERGSQDVESCILAEVSLEIICVWPERPLGGRSQEPVNRCHPLISVWGEESLPLLLALRDTIKSTVVNTYFLMNGYIMKSTGVIRTWGAAAIVKRGELSIKQVRQERYRV